VNSEEVRLGKEHSLSLDIELPQARTSRTYRSKRWRARTFYRSTWSKEQRLGKRVSVRSRWGRAPLVGRRQRMGRNLWCGCRCWRRARAAAAACASRQLLGKGAIGGEKAARGEEFGVRLPALKAACGGGGSRAWRYAGAQWCLGVDALTVKLKV
jgi:hypothetical protein